MCPFTKIEKSNKSLHPREEAQCTVQNIPQGLKNPNLIINAIYCTQLINFTIPVP